jgi:predicted RNase H-like HicB family nuclease
MEAIMSNIIPAKLVLRCYGHKTKKGTWFGLCLDFNLAAEAASREELRKKINEMIATYIESVLDTQDSGSVPELLSRRAPVHDWLIYYLIKFVVFIRQFPDNFTFKEIIPFHLAHNC